MTASCLQIFVFYVAEFISQPVQTAVGIIIQLLSYKGQTSEVGGQRTEIMHVEPGMPFTSSFFYDYGCFTWMPLCNRTAGKNSKRNAAAAHPQIIFSYREVKLFDGPGLSNFSLAVFYQF